MNLRPFRLGVIVVACTVNAFPSVSAAKAEWGNGPVQAIMTAEETAAWKMLRSDEDADAFVALFWARRDPTPGTPRNEYRDDFESAVKAADAQFTHGHVRGSLTDLGRVLLVFGVPAHATRTTVPRGAGVGAGSERPRRPSIRTADISSIADSGNSVDMKWTYDGEEIRSFFGKPHVELAFHDPYGDGSFKVVVRDVDLGAARERAIKAAITQPELTEAPAPARAVATSPGGVPSDGDIKSPALRDALSALKSGGKASRDAALSYAEFLSPSGESYVPVQLYVPSSTLAARGADTIFGAVEDATGNRVASFEERTSLTATKNDFFVDKTLSLPAGKYTAAVGLARAGQPLLLTSGPLEVRGLSRDAAGTSRLILSNNIYEGTIAAPAMAPFAFGRLKIVPKGDLRFTNADELHYFVEINNPAVDPATNMPKILYQLDLSGGGRTTSARLDEVQVLSLTGKPGSGHYALTSSIPLGQLRPALTPGDYTLKMKIVDGISRQSYDLEQGFQITRP